MSNALIYIACYAYYTRAKVLFYSDFCVFLAPPIKKLTHRLIIASKHAWQPIAALGWVNGAIRDRFCGWVID